MEFLQFCFSAVFSYTKFNDNMGEQKTVPDSTELILQSDF